MFSCYSSNVGATIIQTDEHLFFRQPSLVRVLLVQCHFVPDRQITYNFHTRTVCGIGWLKKTPFISEKLTSPPGLVFLLRAVPLKNPRAGETPPPWKKSGGWGRGVCRKNKCVINIFVSCILFQTYLKKTFHYVTMISPRMFTKNPGLWHIKIMCFIAWCGTSPMNPCGHVRRLTWPQLQAM